MRSSSSCRDAGVKQFDWFPMIRGRLVAINGKTVTPDDFADERAKRLVDREFNLSHGAALPRAQQGGAGPLDGDDEAGALSVEEGLARDARPEARRHAALRHRRRHRPRAASPACARSTGVRCGSTSSSCSRRAEMPDVPADLHRRVPRARRRPRLRQRAQRATSRTSPTSTCRRRSRRCSACSTR